jgi:hypothetical protein
VERVLDRFVFRAELHLPSASELTGLEAPEAIVRIGAEDAAKVDKDVEVLELLGFRVGDEAVALPSHVWVSPWVAQTYLLNKEGLDAASATRELLLCGVSLVSFVR